MSLLRKYHATNLACLRRWRSSESQLTSGGFTDVIMLHRSVQTGLPGQGSGVVIWFRKYLKHGSRLALFALAMQFVLSFGHFHAETVRAAPAALSAITDAEPAIAATLASQQGQTDSAQQPSDHDTDRHATDCAICAVLSLANNFLDASPPRFDPPQAVELRPLAIGAEFAHLDTFRSAFRSRAPPVA